MSAKRQPSWELYERMIARMIADQSSTDLCVTPNAHIVGRITKISRQVDVLIEARHDTDNSCRIVVDAKRHNRKVDVTHVEALLGLMADVDATHGYLVCPAGHTKAAEARAQNNVKIRLVPLDRLDDFDPSKWPKCLSSKCRSGRVFWDGYPAFWMDLMPISGTDRKLQRSREFIHYVGKCDRCGYFHVKCATCGDLLFVPHEDNPKDVGHQCSCKLPWFWLASIETDEHERPSAELHFCSAHRVITVDRRSL